MNWASFSTQLMFLAKLSLLQWMPKRKRSAPANKGGAYYRIIVRPKQEFIAFRVQDVGRKGHAERLAGKRDNGSWATHAWFLSKKDAHVVNDRLVGDTVKAKNLIRSLGRVPERIDGDIFRSRDRPRAKENAA